MSDNLTREQFQLKETPVDLPAPNPTDWVDTEGAARILQRTRSTVYEYVGAGVLDQYRIGSHAVYWVADVEHMARALRALGR
jgi:hypothetical protein